MKTHIALAAVLALSACIIDPDDRCGPHQVLTAQETCDCDDVSIWNAERNGCVPCGWDEVRVGDVCECVRCEGQRDPDERPAPVPVAPELTSAIGDACESNASCLGAVAPTCVETPEGGGYCTTDGCADDEACGEGHFCRPEGATTMCRRMPTGMGATCAGDDDCATYDAQHCQPQGGVCLISKCSMAPDDCPPGWGCCDLSGFGADNLCVPPGSCPT